jgi:threonine dehydratase
MYCRSTGKEIRMTVQPIPEIADIEAAAHRISGFAVRTPLIESPVLNALTGGRILLKAECLQRTGSFKFRGAWNKISQLDPKLHKGGVVAYSSGNHAQGVAAAAQIKGLPALIVMPKDTPLIKQNNTKGYGADVVLYDRERESREEIARRYTEERQAVLVPPFEDTDIIAGQGTSGLEIAEQAEEAGAKPHAILVSASGGGLTAGIALAAGARLPESAVYTVEPEGFDDYARSLAAGRRVRNTRAAGSLCDALMSREPGETTFEINRRRLASGLVVSDEEVKRAMRFGFETLKLVIEPGGSAALAAVLAGKIETRGRIIVAVISGGNVDGSVFARVLGEAA